MSYPTLQLVKMQFEDLIERTSAATAIQVLSYVIQDRHDRAKKAEDEWSAVQYRRVSEMLDDAANEASTIAGWVELPQVGP